MSEQVVYVIEEGNSPDDGEWAGKSFHTTLARAEIARGRLMRSEDYCREPHRIVKRVYVDTVVIEA